MAKKKIGNLIAFESEVLIGGKSRATIWNNQAFGYAEQFLKKQGVEIATEDIINEISQIKFRSIKASLFGAIKASNKNYTVAQFQKDFSFSEIKNYIEAVANGVENYLPNSSIEENEENLPKV